MDKQEQQIKNGYLGLELPTKARIELLQQFPPIHDRVIAHHVTVEFKPSKLSDAELQRWLTSDHAVVILGVASDHRVQAVVVSVDGQTHRPDGCRYHVTISCSGNGKPADSKELCADDNNISFMAHRKLATIKATIIPY